MSEFSIGQLARSAGVSIDTVRYYERHGLLSPRTRLASGYRRYGALEATRLRFIRRAKVLGFSLRDIQELLDLGAQSKVGAIKRKAGEKLAEIDQRMAELKRIRSGLQKLVAACPGHGRSADCPILQALGQQVES